MKRFLPVASTLAFALICAGSARAQDDAQPLAGVLQAPADITGIVSIDAHNTLLVESQAPGEPKQYSLFVVRHIYSGGLARLFGGSIIPTEALVIPESARRSSFASPSVSPGIGGNNNRNSNFNSGYNNFGNTGNGSIGNGNTGNGLAENSNSFNRSFPLYAPQIPFIQK